MARPRTRTSPPQLILAFDFGTRRIGVASGDTLTRTARALQTLDCAPAACPGRRSTSSCAEYQPAAARRRPAL